MGDSRSDLTTGRAAQRQYLFVLCMVRVVIRVRAGPGGSGPAGRGETETDGERRAGGGDKGARARGQALGSPGVASLLLYRSPVLMVAAGGGRVAAGAAPTRDPERPVGAGTEASRCGSPQAFGSPGRASAAGLFPRLRPERPLPFLSSSPGLDSVLPWLSLEAGWFLGL